MKNIKFLTALIALIFAGQFTFAQSALDNGRSTTSVAASVENIDQPVQNKDVPQAGVFPVDFDYNSESAEEAQEDVYYPIDMQVLQEEVLASSHPAVIAEKVNAMNATIEDLRRVCEELRLENKVIRESLGNCCSTSDLGLSATDAYLVQNAPNPFTAGSEISYFVPEGLDNVEIRICDFKGEVLKTLEITEAGYGKIAVDAKGLNSGSFVYMLAVEGEIIDSKLMMITK